MVGESYSLKKLPCRLILEFMTKQLFRPEAVRHSTRRLEGDVIVVTPLATWLLGLVTFAVLFAVVVFAASAHYSKKETVRGWLVPEAGAVRIIAPQGGVIDELVIEPGTIVQQGQQIARVSLSVASRTGDAGTELLTTIENQYVAMSYQFEAAEERLDAEEARLKQQRSNIELEQQTLAIQVEAMEGRLREAKDTREWARKNLEEGITSRQDYENWNAVVLNHEADKLALERSNAQFRTQLADIDQQLAAIKPQRKAARADLLSAQAQLNERKAQTQSQNEYFVTSSVDGVIDAITVKPGQSIPTGGTVAILTPDGSPLIAEMYVPSRAAGFIQPGQAVSLKYDAFPYQRFGTGIGEVKEVSRTILTPEEVQLAGIQFREPVFRVRAELDSNQVIAYGDFVPLRSGMMLSADIVIDRRNLLEWLLDPLYSAGRR